MKAGRKGGREGGGEEGMGEGKKGKRKHTKETKMDHYYKYVKGTKIAKQL